ncbi:hypothetical protein [Mesorhizobium sp. WSM3860]|uniref:hypothetical protein n=1 Tax=Mesorhizobium sp. WSM3860 TaxID=2029403 RepID=UPI00159704BA|nr:hypothetical protein [Mesorhizobium sp. WSM3860]
MMERKLAVIAALPEECRERVEARFEGLDDAGIESSASRAVRLGRLRQRLSPIRKINHLGSRRGISRADM